ncbi:MAG: pyridoxamine 5'-phosphate oxidase family protein [Deferribacteres bacterium]|nr:pyridoxamine 5'-phosphate oxidase family protein [candidate division KSB1 bacterium]MCB9500411.1 pyridoxamine 5'-phosphate oxidase family protein [Deferribacteres bacterium]
MLKKIQKTVGRRLLNTYKTKIQKSFDPSVEHCLDSARTLLKKAKYCFLITHSERPWPSTRMVQPIIDFDAFEIWFGTNPKLRKIEEIKKDQNVTVAFGNETEDANLIIYGKAVIVEDMQARKQHWKGSWHLFFPGGPQGENFISIRVEPVEMELMHFKKNIVPEPFGLNPVKIIKTAEGWETHY